MIEKTIALKIKKIREAKGLTLAALGERTGLSKALLSRIENNRSSPPIATLTKIAQGLEVPVAFFFQNGEEETPRYTTTRAGERKKVVGRASSLGFIYYLLSGMNGPHLIDAFIMRHPTACPTTTRPLYEHPGEELLFVLRGEIKFTYGKECIHLGPGDAIHFDPSYPHKAENAAQEETECLVIVVAKGAPQSFVGGNNTLIEHKQKQETS